MVTMMNSAPQASRSSGSLPSANESVFLQSGGCVLSGPRNSDYCERVGCIYQDIPVASQCRGCCNWDITRFDKENET